MQKESIQLLQQAEVLRHAIEQSVNVNVQRPDIVLPEGYKIESLEDCMPHLRHYRMNYVTRSLEDFAEYAKKFAMPDSTIFINESQMEAKLFVDIGSPDAPLHKKHTANLALKKSAAFLALLSISASSRIDQKTLAEFISDHADIISGRSFNEIVMTASEMAKAVRHITIDKVKKLTSVVGAASGSLSSLEKFEATGEFEIPHIIKFTCEPYLGLPEQTFMLIINIEPGDNDKPRINVRLHNQDGLPEIFAQQFKVLLKEKLGDLAKNAYLGEAK